MKRVPLVLASRSPRRQRLLKQIGLRFTVRPSNVPERFVHRQSPAHNARRLALAKARDVAESLDRGIVIGADTIVAVDGRILGKPAGTREAGRMLRLLSGRSHIVYTAFALVEASSGRSLVDVVSTRVWFRKLTAAEIRDYVASGSPLDKAGAYGIQDDYGAVFVERIKGCFYNVVGFPLTRFYLRLSEFTDHQEQR